ncbi:MAG: TIGR02757 family protein, partial [Nitrospiria bacterium]
MRRSDRLEESARCLDLLLEKNVPAEHIKSDPIEIPHRYDDPREIEIAALISALLAYGRIDLFKKVIERMLDLAEGRLFQYIHDFSPERERPRFKGIYYRFNTEEDLFSLIHLLSRVVRARGSIGAYFLSTYREDNEDTGPALTRFTALLKTLLPRPVSPGLRYLFPSPKTGSACKRLNLFLRWMVRPNDGVDFGLWTRIPARKLIIPLDTHVIRIAKYLKMTTRKTPDWKMAREITAFLKRCAPEDPLKYDFALCHLGVSGGCPLEANPKKCGVCPLLAICSRGNHVVHGSA